MICAAWFTAGLFGHFLFDLLLVALGAVGVVGWQRFKCRHH